MAVALAKIAETGNYFVSRGDQSGTHIREMELWESAGIKPEGKWYLDIGQEWKQSYCLVMRTEVMY